MDKRKIRKKLIAIMVDKGYVLSDANGSEHLTNDLGLDSLDVVDFMMAIERKFDIRFPDSDATIIGDMTVDQLLEHIEKKLG